MSRRLRSQAQFLVRRSDRDFQAEHALPHRHVAHLVDEDEGGGQEVVVGADAADEPGVGPLGRDLDLEGQADEGVSGGRVLEVVVVPRGGRGHSALLDGRDLGVAMALVVAAELGRVRAEAGREERALQAKAVERDRVVLEEEGGGEDLEVVPLRPRRRFRAREQAQGGPRHPAAPWPA